MKKIILIAYFSRAGENYMRGKIVNLEHGNTEIAAGTIARLTGAPVFRIVPMNEYPEKYKECTEAAQKELMDRLRRRSASTLTMMTMTPSSSAIPAGGAPCRCRSGPSSGIRI